MEASPDIDCFAQMPWYYLQEAIGALLKCLGFDSSKPEDSSSSSQGGDVKEQNPQHTPSTTDPDTDPPSVSVVTPLSLSLSLSVLLLLKN